MSLLNRVEILKPAHLSSMQGN